MFYFYTFSGAYRAYTSLYTCIIHIYIWHNSYSYHIIRYVVYLYKGQHKYTKKGCKVERYVDADIVRTTHIYTHTLVLCRSSHRCEMRNGKIMLCKAWVFLKKKQQKIIQTIRFLSSAIFCCICGRFMLSKHTYVMRNVKCNAWYILCM